MPGIEKSAIWKVMNGVSESSAKRNHSIYLIVQKNSRDRIHYFGTKDEIYSRCNGDSHPISVEN